VADVDTDLIRGVGKRDAGLVVLLDVEKTLRMSAIAA
jgi:chemotaxis signal transduction protein